MSSYLNIYGVPKEGGKPIEIVSFSRSHCIYEALYEGMSIDWAGDGEVYTDITSDNIDRIIEGLESDLNKCNSGLQVYEKYASQNPEYIQEILSLQEYIEELKTTKHYCEMINMIVADTTYSGFSKICCNIS